MKHGDEFDRTLSEMKRSRESRDLGFPWIVHVLLLLLVLGTLYLTSDYHPVGLRQDIDRLERRIERLERR